PALHLLLESHATSTLSSETFPYTKPPPLDPTDSSVTLSTTSLRSAAAKPTWAKSRTGHAAAGAENNRQRVVVFLAGGATFSEARCAYDMGRATGREVVLVTSHMLTPALFLRQVADLSVERRRLGLPVDGAKPQAPAHLLEPDPKP
ncbi:syntaxin binding protein 1, partial [Teratosphaeriaceae sp. CCFEE 6253]